MNDLVQIQFRLKSLTYITLLQYSTLVRLVLKKVDHQVEAPPRIMHWRNKTTVCFVCHGKEEKVDRNRSYEVRYYFGVDLTSYQYINATFRSKFSCASLQVFTPNFTLTKKMNWFRMYRKIDPRTE